MVCKVIAEQEENGFELVKVVLPRRPLRFMTFVLCLKIYLKDLSIPLLLYVHVQSGRLLGINS